jgi:DNA-directed RNA polymerase subunit M/transcription elongation factor TFIIS
MKFCDKCDNMYYIGINPDDTNKLVYYCRNCNYVDETLTDEGVCLLNTQFASRARLVSISMRQFIALITL